MLLANSTAVSNAPFARRSFALKESPKELKAAGQAAKAKAREAGGSERKVTALSWKQQATGGGGKKAREKEEVDEDGRAKKKKRTATGTFTPKMVEFASAAVATGRERGERLKERKGTEISSGDNRKKMVQKANELLGGMNGF